MGNNQYTRKWERLYTYGGKFAENITQAVARDVLGHNMPLIESSGYEIDLTVHDEVITKPMTYRNTTMNIYQACLLPIPNGHLICL